MKTYWDLATLKRGKNRIFLGTLGDYWTKIRRGERERERERGMGGSSFVVMWFF